MQAMDKHDKDLSDFREGRRTFRDVHLQTTPMGAHLSSAGNNINLKQNQ